MAENTPLDPDKVDKFYQGYNRPDKDEDKQKPGFLSSLLEKLGLKTFEQRRKAMQEEADKTKD